MAKTDADQCADLIDDLGWGTPDDRPREHVGGNRGHGFEDFGTLVALRDEVDPATKPFTERMRVAELRPELVRGLTIDLTKMEGPIEIDLRESDSIVRGVLKVGRRGKHFFRRISARFSEGDLEKLKRALELSVHDLNDSQSAKRYAEAYSFLADALGDSDGVMVAGSAVAIKADGRQAGFILTAAERRLFDERRLDLSDPIAAFAGTLSNPTDERPRLVEAGLYPGALPQVGA